MLNDYCNLNTVTIGSMTKFHDLSLPMSAAKMKRESLDVYSTISLQTSAGVYVSTISRRAICSTTQQVPASHVRVSCVFNRLRLSEENPQIMGSS